MINTNNPLKQATFFYPTGILSFKTDPFHKIKGPVDKIDSYATLNLISKTINQTGDGNRLQKTCYKTKIYKIFTWHIFWSILSLSHYILIDQFYKSWQFLEQVDLLDSDHTIVNILIVILLILLVQETIDF